MVDSVDDVVADKEEKPELRQSGLDGFISMAWNNLKSETKQLGKFVGKTAVTGAVAAAGYYAVGKSAILTAIGNAVGYIIEKVKGRQKMSYNDLTKETCTGALMGLLGHNLYSMIDFIPNYNMPLKILKTVAFNPIMLAPYVAFYQAFTYLRDKVGIAKSALGLLNFKIFKYLKDAYYNEIKPNFTSSMKKIMYLSPIHFASINYVNEIWKRVAIGVGNDIAFRLFQSKKKEKPEYAASKSSYRNLNFRYLNPAPASG